MITIETELRGHVPPPDAPEASIAEDLLRTICAQELVGKGCDPDSITFEQPRYAPAEGVWTIRGTGIKED